MKKSKIGTVVWTDLTVPDAAEIRDFYSKVLGWKTTEHDGDFNVHPPHSDDIISGICYKRGSNANIPSQWLNYIAVESVSETANKCIEAGGSVIDGPRQMGGSMFAVLQDPAGAVFALYEVKVDDSE